MLDIERRVSQSLNRIRDVHTESYREQIPRLRGEVVLRTQRRRRSMVGLAVATALAIVAALLVVPTTLVDREQPGPAASDRTFIEIPTGAPSRITASGDNVWLVSPTELRRIDAETNRLATLIQGFTAEDVVDVAAEDDFAWIIGGGDGATLSSQNVSGRGLFSVQYGDSALESVVAAEGYVWVADSASSSVWKINPRTGSVVQRYPAGRDSLPDPIELAAGHGYIWLLAGENLFRMDPNPPGDSTAIGVGGCGGLAVGEGAVWVLDSCNDVVTRYDPETLEVVGTVESDGRDFGDQIAAGLGSLWTTGETVTRIDSEANRIVGPPVEVDGGAADIAVGSDSVWIATPRGVLRYTPNDVSPAPQEETPRGGVVNRSALGMWPEIDYDEAAEACDQFAENDVWRTDPRRLVARFAVLHLGLPEVDVRESSRDRFGWDFRIVPSEGPVRRPMSVRVRRVPQMRCWVVESITTYLDAMRSSRQVGDDGTFILDIDLSVAVESVVVELGQVGRPPLRVGFAPEDFPVELEGYKPDTPGYLLVTFHRHGWVVFAEGRPLD